MRFYALLTALFVAIVAAQNNQISIPETGLVVQAGVPVTITWTNPSSGTVTIKLQQGSNITPDSGIIVASGIDASAGTATFIIDPASVNTFQYVFEIIDDTNPDNYNFSTNFGIIGATGTSIATTSGVASITSSASATGSTSSGSITNSITSTGSSSSGTASTMATSSRTVSSSRSSTSESAAATSIASSGNGASGLQISGGMMAIVLGAIAAF